MISSEIRALRRGKKGFLTLSVLVFETRDSVASGLGRDSTNGSKPSGFRWEALLYHFPGNSEIAAPHDSIFSVRVRIENCCLRITNFEKGIAVASSVSAIMRIAR